MSTVRQTLRKTILFAWIVLLPITFNWMSPVLIIMAGFEGYISLSFLFFAGWFISSIFLGRLYCAYGCQWGAMMEIYGDTIKKPLDPTKKARNSKIKYPVFVIWVAFIILGPFVAGGYLSVNPYYPDENHNLVSWDGGLGGAFFFFLIPALLLLVTLVGGRRAFCRYACPMGVLGIIGSWIARKLRIPSLHLDAETDKCVKCKQCSKACPMGLDVDQMVLAGQMLSPDCILCGSCIDTCKKSVISYAWKWRKTSIPEVSGSDSPNLSPE